MLRPRTTVSSSYIANLVVIMSVCLFVSPLKLSACTVPVFRYALERWVPDTYVVEIQYHGTLSAKDQAIVDYLRKRQRTKKKDSGHTNLRVLLIETKTTTESSERPTMTLRFPLKTRNTTAIWEGELTADNATKLVNSPLRKEIAKRILGGDSAVWVLLNSGNKEKDEKAAELLRNELKAAQKEFKLPELAAVDANREAPDNLPDVRLAFSMVALSREDPAEKLLIETLLRTESDLLGFTDEPIVFPVFGQGRVLYALIGKGISKATIHEACTFLTGACACTDKVGNPGVDLLMTAVWWNKDMTSAIREIKLPELTGVAPMNPATVTNPPPVDAALPAEAKNQVSTVRIVIYCLVGFGVIVWVSSMYVSRNSGE